MILYSWLRVIWPGKGCRILWSTYLLDLSILAHILQGTTKIQIICMKCPPSHILDFLDLRHLFSASMSTARIYIYCLNLLFFKFFFFLKRGVSYHTLLYIDKTFTTSQHLYFSTNSTQFTKIIQENKIMLYHYDNQHIPTLNVNC